MNIGYKGNTESTYKRAKMEIASIYGRKKKKNVEKSEKKTEEKYIKRYRVVIDFCIMENGQPLIYKSDYFDNEKNARKEKNRLFELYQQAVETGNVIYMEKCFIETRYFPI